MSPSASHRVPVGQLSQRAILLRLRWTLGCLLLLIFGQAWSQALSPAAGLERQVKAAYLFKFAGFVEWPEASFARPDSPLVIGVAGSEQLADQLERTVAGRNVNGHPLRVRRIRQGEALTDLHILFLDTSLERSAMELLLTAARGQSLLTVSDAADAMALGCMINFVVADDKLRFDVALRHVAPSRLRISARMLAVAHRVQGVT
jgi:hypothetical protein